jgi:MraZ protein
MGSWEPIYEKISNLNDFDPKVREFRRYFFNFSTQLELDSAGRLLVPPNLKDHAGLEKDIVLVAAVNKIEIWDKGKYQQFFESFSPETFSSLAAQVMSGNDKLIVDQWGYEKGKIQYTIHCAFNRCLSYSSDAA